MKNEKYTSDYVFGDPSYDYKIFQKYDEQIAKYKNIKFELIELRDQPGQTDEMKVKIDEVIDNVSHYISEFEEIRHKRYEEGIYEYQWRANSGVKSQFIKRVEGNNCDECIFKHMPCLNIRSYYGCHTTPEYSVNNETRNGELIRSGHFIEIEQIESIKPEAINAIEKYYGGSNKKE